MEFLIVVVIIAVIGGGAYWNHQNSAAAFAGVEFHVDAPPSVVHQAIMASYCGGAKAMLKSLVSRMTVTPSGAHAFRTQSSIGDAGIIEIFAQGSGTTVRARATELYVGSPPSQHFRSGFLGIGARITHGLCTLLGVSPNAAKVKRFHAGVERKVTAAMRKAPA
jgi:hypothetical protein